MLKLWTNISGLFNNLVLRRPVESTQYASRAYRKLSAAFKINVSMSRRANAWDNAPMESFFKTLKVERIYPTHYETRAHARLDIVDWIEGYYNRQRLHTSIDFLTRVGYEASLIVA
ncbi:integrase core domain-containing protein [Burkholderia cepacia]|uniref:integrase core domain-containing protein n=1 Tax=Burkholderia cepacia TaxID=292 RepID=UPI0009BE9B4E|nr:integrase core domain-containing protein [Burkholderia cepacia]